MEYQVQLPVTGIVHVEVEADSADEAIEKALESYSSEEVETWEAVSAIVRGNVFYGMLNKASATEQE